MSKNEWLDGLREALMSELPQNEIDNNLMYYRDYIEQQMSMNQETEVLQSLGEPRLIAKTIIDTYKLQRGNDAYGENASNYDYSNMYEQNRSDRNETVDESGNVEKNHTSYYHVGQIRWYHKAIFFAILAILLVVVIFIGGVLLRFFFMFGLPILIILLLIQLLKRR